MSTTMLSISKCCCQFRLSCSLFWCQTHVGASSYFFFQTKENGLARHLAAIIVEHPLPCSGRIPCQALLTPARVYWFPWVAPARALCLFETPASKGTPKLCQGFRVRLNLKYYLRPATTQFPAQVWKCKRSASALGAGRWLLPVRLSQGSWQHHPANASVFTVVLARWYKAPLPQCDCYLAKAELESFYVPVDLDWLQFGHRRLSHCPNFFDGRLLSLALGLLLSKDQVARQCTRHCSQ